MRLHAPRRPEMRATTGCSVWVGIFTLLAGVYWPNTVGFVFIALAFVGLLHLAVLAYEQVTAPVFYEKMSPEEFEHYCAAVLRQRKWIARVTQQGADQGVDIVADKRGLRIVLQCKKYSRPVGNFAVQEIVAGIAHLSAQRGVVVTNSDYTIGARKLAASNDVLLLHHSQLGRIDRLLRKPFELRAWLKSLWR